MFAGRGGELLTLEQALIQTKNGNPHHILIHGERGIGKSSLLTMHQWTATGEVDSYQAGKFNFVVISIELEPSITYGGLVRKVGSEFERVVISRSGAKEKLKVAWDFLKRWEVMGVKYNAEQEASKPATDLLDDLTHTVCTSMKDLGDSVDGAIISIDEADKPSVTANLGAFCKLFVERLTKRGCNNVAICVAGISTVLETLRKSHESAPRMFEGLTLAPLTSDESVDVVRRGLAEANKKNSTETSIDADAEKLIAKLSEGYPHFIQQFAYSAFNHDSDNKIDIVDVTTGAEEENGALQQLGLKYFSELYFDKIASDEYRKVLQVMAEKLDAWVSRAEISGKSGLKPSTLNNALTALKKRRIILPKPGTPSMYKLPTKAFAVWIRAFSDGQS